MASTTGSTKNSPKTKNYQPAKNMADVENIRDITREQLDFFPFLKAAPDIMYWLMATWGAESTWQLHFKKKGGIITSLHYTASPPARESVAGLGTIKSTGTLIGNGYQYSNVIQNVWNDPAVTLQTRENIREGWYPHGITACMGTYHVRGCPNNIGEWRYYPEAVERITTLGLEVNPGQSIFQTLFPIDDETCRRRSIASGMIIFNYKYRRALETRAINNPSAAIQIAVGNFLGKFGTRDNNNVSPEDRVRQLNATKGNIVSILEMVKIRRSGATTELAKSLIDLSDKDAKDRSSVQVQNVPARPATTVAASNGKSSKIPGCEVV